MLLIKSGSDPNATTVRGETALHLATRGNQTDIMRLLIRQGAQVDAKAKVRQNSTDVGFTHDGCVTQNLCRYPCVLCVQNVSCRVETTNVANYLVVI